jgi:aminoglycoside phosphotransferase (APT) family kinase protein
MSRVTSDARPVRETEQLAWDRVEHFLRARLSEHEVPRRDFTQRMEVEQFHGGHSNLTYLIRFGQTELVLRRPPLGPVAPTAHDMAREYRWLAAMHPVFPLAPRPYVLCDDLAVAGAIFYLMERRRGLVIRTEEPPQLAGRPDQRQRMSAAVIDTLATLHAVDIETSGLTPLGKPAGFVTRQVKGWTERWHRSKIDEIPEMEALAAWLAAHLPSEPHRPTVVHGDFKLDNVMVDPDDVARLVGVFDWEMSALGDPLIDLGILVAYWCHIKPVPGHDALNSVTSQPGWFTRDEIVDRYASKSGADLSALRFYEAFALFKVAVVIQQIYFRYRQGQTDDPRFAHFGDRVLRLARAGEQVSR